MSVIRTGEPVLVLLLGDCFRIISGLWELLGGLLILFGSVKFSPRLFSWTDSDQV